MVHQFDHRWATYEGSEVREVTAAEKQDPNFPPLPRYWVAEANVLAATPSRGGSTPGWLFGFRDIARSTDERTAIFGILPSVAVGNKFPLAVLSVRDASLASCLQACCSAMAFDFAVRQKLGGTTMNFFYVQQLPVLPPTAFAGPCPWVAPLALREWIAPRSLELAYTAWDLEPFARDCGYAGPPFRWDEERRFLLCCELDAASFPLYGIARDDVDYILETFPIVRRRDEAAYGEYRTRRVILEAYDAMQRAIDTGESYQTLLDPPPADPRVAHAHR